MISSFNVTAELAKLQSQRAIGGAKHRKQVLDKMQEIKQTLAESVFAFSAQVPLDRAATLRIMQHLQASDTLNADGTLPDDTLALLMALLYSFDVRMLEQEQSEGERINTTATLISVQFNKLCHYRNPESYQAFPVIRDDDHIVDVHKEVLTLQEWKIPELKSVARFAWALTLRMLSQYYSQGASDLYEQDESLIDCAVADDIFSFLRRAVLVSPKFHQEVCYT